MWKYLFCRYLMLFKKTVLITFSLEGLLLLKFAVVECAILGTLYTCMWHLCVLRNFVKWIFGLKKSVQACCVLSGEKVTKAEQRWRSSKWVILSSCAIAAQLLKHLISDIQGLICSWVTVIHMWVCFRHESSHHFSLSTKGSLPASSLLPTCS